MPIYQCIRDLNPRGVLPELTNCTECVNGECRYFINWEPPTVDEKDRMLKWFGYGHLPEHLKDVSSQFYELACSICELLEAGPERTVALRKLLESKDAAVRAKLYPGG